jgi:cell wall assembly regulator SMI1
LAVVEADTQALEILRGLVAGAIRAPEEEPPRGARPEELDSLTARLGGRISGTLRAWLSVCRGARIGPGGVFGQRPDTPDVDMVRRRNLFPGWAELGWLPVAGDGCGNYYVLAEDGTVGFVDTMKDPDRLDRQVASDLLSFMIELLAHDQEVDRTRN